MASSKRPTIEDVAREAGVSITTVSRYLNERYEFMSVKTKKHIGDVIRRLNYRPNAMARGLKANRTRLIAVIVVNISYPFCASVIRALSDVTAPAGFGLLVYDTGGDPKREREFLLSLRSQNVDGIVIQTNGANLDLLREFAEDVAIVMVDRKFDIPQAATVITDNEEASYAVTTHLFDGGYDEVIYVTEAEVGISTREERLQGYRNACAKNGRNPRVEWVDKSDSASIHQLVERLRANAPSGSFAIYAANGLIMLELYPLLLELGYPVPGRMGIATFDDPDWATVTTPPLTSVRQPTTEMGRLAATIILNRVEGNNVVTPASTIRVIPSEVVLRPSTMR